MHLCIILCLEESTEEIQSLMATMAHRYTLCYCTGPAKAISLWSGGVQNGIYVYRNLAGGIQPLGRSRACPLGKCCK